MKRTIAILTVLLLQGAAIPALFAASPRSGCCQTTHCQSAKPCCQFEGQKPVEVPVPPQPLSFDNFVSPIFALSISEGMVMSVATGRLVSHHAPPLFVVHSSFLL